MFKHMQSVIWIDTDNQGKQYIADGTALSHVKETVKVLREDGTTIPMYDAFLWPNLPGPKLLLETTIAMNERHKLESAELFKETLQMNNLCVKEGWK